ncbi:dephospho-CoA kinase [Chitinibacter sp. S2-10]|uniref:dephospho-CoA kinase n=1 Tax=Chitinibacter sp. S2-10 TaxID=3373597 RepID=UPI003977850A
MIVGLTGGIGSGKSTVASYLMEKNIPVIDADKIAHELTQAKQPAVSEISAIFGADCLNEEGELDRSWLRESIYKDPVKKQLLEQVLHPKILAECKRQLIHNQAAIYQILMIPLLIEHAEFRSLCDSIITVESTEEARITRVMQRNGLSREVIQLIINNQLTDAERRQEADHLIYNNDSLESLKRQVDQLDLFLRQQCHIQK